METAQITALMHLQGLAQALAFRMRLFITAMAMGVAPHFFIAQPAYADEICSLVTTSDTIRSVSDVARAELGRRGYQISADRGRDLVENCGDFYIFSLAFDREILGGVPYVLVSRYGEILWVMETQ